MDEMLEKGELDAVVLCSVTACHYQEILIAAAAGVSMLVEKPVVGETEQYQRVRRAIEQNRVMLFPGHNFMYRRPLSQMKKLLDEKALGTILQSSFFSAQLLDTSGTENWRRQKELSCGGALIDSGHHLIYQMLYLLGVPARLQAFTANLRLLDLDGEDTAQLNMQMTDGSLCVITESWASEAADQLNGIRILGTDGEMHLTDALYVMGKDSVTQSRTTRHLLIRRRHFWTAWMVWENRCRHWRIPSIRFRLYGQPIGARQREVFIERNGISNKYKK